MNTRTPTEITISHPPGASIRVRRRATTICLRGTATVAVAFACLLLPCARAGAAGYALSFNGVNQYVSLPSGTLFYGDFTIEVWIYARALNANARVLECGNSGSADNVALVLANTNTGPPMLVVYNQSTSTSLTAPTALPSNQWVHVAATLSGTTGRIYTNGQLAASGTLQAPRAVTRSSNCIGRRNTSASGYANAILDEVRIWNTARTQLEIQTNMFTPSHQLQMIWSCWDFNEGGGSTAYGWGGEMLNGALQNGPLWVSPGMPSVPTITNTYAQVDSPTTASLFSSVIPNGLPTTAWFRWGTGGSYASTTPTFVGDGTTAVTNSAGVGPLSRGTTYSFCLVATNVAGTTFGSWQTFSTPPSSNANLAGLWLYNGTLTPAFDPAVTNYTASVFHNVTSNRVTAFS